MFGSETWTLTEAEWARLQSFEMQCLRRVIGWRGRMTTEGIRYPRNEDVWREVRRIRSVRTLRESVESRQVVWWGRVLRMGESSLTRSALLASVPKPAYVGWHRTRALVARFRKLVARAGLEEADHEERDVWSRRAMQMAPTAAIPQPITVLTVTQTGPQTRSLAPAPVTAPATALAATPADTETRASAATPAGTEAAKTRKTAAAKAARPPRGRGRPKAAPQQ